MQKLQTQTDKLSPGVEFSVKGEGRYRLVRIRDNGELNAWGPIQTDGNMPHGMMRSFKPEQVRVVHRKDRAR